ncbi:MAG: response regulator transcription factor [Phycisphaerae bacterium]|nr:response regulator transcription factor [Phycisphaerae bacterium]
MKTKVLIVDDEPNVLRVLDYVLAAQGYEIISADNGAKALKKAVTERPDLIILDIILPDMSGFEVCRELRACHVDVPILMLTGRKSVDDRVRGLDTGADDYVPKPFDFDEFLARVRALARRPKSQANAVLRIGDITLDRLSRQVSFRGKPVALPSREFELLEYFMSHPGKVLRRSQILADVWKKAQEPNNNVVDVYVSQLRKKLQSPDTLADVIQTVRGEGYVLQTAVASNV